MALSTPTMRFSSPPPFNMMCRLRSFLLWLQFLRSYTSALTAFQQFTFSPNGVCIQPNYFVDSASANERLFTLRNVPGEGDCMFLATALAAATSLGLGANDVLLKKISQETRNVVAEVLASEKGNLIIAPDRVVSTRALLASASKEENVTPEQYLELLQLDGVDGGLYGGGPELVVLSNILRRPISIYELVSEEVLSEPCPIECKGVFGQGVFTDACMKIPESAILNQAVPGAYSWHLHLLVVQANQEGEKHACVLLPQ